MLFDKIIVPGGNMKRMSFVASAAALVWLISSAIAAPFGADIVGKHGMTHSSLVLQNDVNNMMHNAVPILVERATGNQQSIACGKMLRTDTVVTHMDNSQQWSETWTYQVCQTQIAIPIDFTPDGHGGANFAVKTENVKVTPMRAHR
jgi:hypothetical protein